jgi:hypothetical protein
LFWGKDRTAVIADVWAELHMLKDKLDRGIEDFSAEMYVLRDQRESVATAYRDAVRQLAQVLREAADMLLPLGM